MTDSNDLQKSGHLSIIAGTILLIIALLIIVTSNDNISAQKKTLPNEQTSYSADLTISEAATDNPVFDTSDTNNKNSDISSNEQTTDNEEESTASAINSLSKRKRKKLIDFDAKFPYLIRVNRAENFAVVYGIDYEGKHTIPYKAFICSTGRKAKFTPLGVFEMSDKYRWRLMVDNTYAQYAIRINGQIMLHSVPYLEPYSDAMESWEYNKLGKPASLGCIRFRASAIKWIYNHCEAGTKVNIYSKSGEVPPLDIPPIEKIKKSDPKAGWDPTDSEKGNPWKKKKNSKLNFLL